LPAFVAVACTGGSSGSHVASSAPSLTSKPTQTHEPQQADYSFAGGLNIKPDHSWAEPRTISLYAADRASLAVVHGHGGFYALDLQGVPECPANIREGEGRSVRGSHMLFTCADGSTWAEFDAFGKAVRGPQSKDRPALRVVAHDDGSLVVFREPPPLPLEHYWPSS